MLLLIMLDSCSVVASNHVAGLDSVHAHLWLQLCRAAKVPDGLGEVVALEGLLGRIRVVLGTQVLQFRSNRVLLHKRAEQSILHPATSQIKRPCPDEHLCWSLGLAGPTAS